MKKKDLIFLAVLILLSVTTHWQWFFRSYILSFSDWMFLFTETAREQFALPSIWNATSFGSVNLFLSFYPIAMIMGFLANWGISYAYLERIVFMWPMVIFAVISSYTLGKYVTKSSIGALMASIVYSYNTYFLQGQTSHLTLMTAYAIIPFALYFFIRTLEEKNYRFSLITGLLVGVLSFYESRVLYLVIWIFFFYFIYVLMFIPLNKKSRKTVIQYVVLGGIPIAIAGLLNSYWILGLMKLEALTTNELFSRGLFGNEFANMRQALSFFHPFWTGGELAVFEVQPVPIHFWLIPVTAFLGLYLNRKNKFTLYFGFISLLGIFLTKQVDTPFPYIYQWLFDHLPGFNAFREASKFYMFISLGYSILIAFFTAYIYKNISKTYISHLFIVILAAVFLWNTKPLVTGEIRTLFVERNIPSDYETLKNHLLKEDDFIRILWIPRDSRWSYYDSNTRNLSGVNLAESFWKEFSNFGDEERDFKFKEYILRPLQGPYSNNLLDMSSIKYVIVPLQDLANDDNFFSHYGNREKFLQVVSKLPYLRRINIGTKDIVVFENVGYRPLIYATKAPEDLAKVVPFAKIDFQKVRTTEYKTLIENPPQSFFIHFTERFDPNWKLSVDDKTAEIKHMRNVAGLNTFQIINSKNAMLNLELQYKPQEFVNTGLIISIITFGIVIVGIVYLTFRRHK